MERTDSPPFKMAHTGPRRASWARTAPTRTV